MKRAFLFLFTCLSFVFISNALARPACDAFGEAGYNSGYVSGDEDKTRGDKFDAEGYWALPLMQMTLKNEKEKLEQDGHFSEKDIAMFDSCTKSGFIEGYHDGYYGKPQKKLNYLPPQPIADTSGDCYSLGYRWARCATLVMFGKACPPEDDFSTPERCRGTDENRRGSDAGVRSIYHELGMPTNE